MQGYVGIWQRCVWHCSRNGEEAYNSRKQEIGRKAVDYKQRMFYGIADGNVSKMPFYMAYPMQSVYMEELEYERDMRKLKDMYPKEVRSIQTMVEDECDKMEYEGSLMFDEYPDKVMLNQIVNRIYNSMAIQKTDLTGEAYDTGEYEAGQYEAGQYEAEQYETGAYEAEQYEEERYEGDMQAEELPLEGTLVSQMRPRGPGRPPGGPGWNPGRPPGGPGWNPGRPPGGPGWNPGRPPGGPGMPPPPPGNGLQNLIEVLLYNEMYQRRCRHKRCRRWW